MELKPEAIGAFSYTVGVVCGKKHYVTPPSSNGLWTFENSFALTYYYFLTFIIMLIEKQTERK